MAIRIDGTNTAANPGITGADTDTGLSFGTNEVSINTDGTERFRVGSAGQFGIGGATYGSSGQVLTSQGSSSAPQWADASSGKVISVASDTETAEISFGSSNTWFDTGLSVSVTTTTSTQRVHLSCDVGRVDGSAASQVAAFRFVRGTTPIGIGDQQSGTSDNLRASFFTGLEYNNNYGHSASGQFYDSPGAAGTYTYKVQAAVNNTAVRINRSGNCSNSGTAQCSTAISTLTAYVIEP